MKDIQHVKSCCTIPTGSLDGDEAQLEVTPKNRLV